MKGVILAGGNGTRLYPLTKVTNKHLLPVYNKPMIYYPIQTLIEGGIKDILIVSGKAHSGHFVSLLGSGREFGVKISYEVQEEAGGIAQALSLAEDFSAGEPVCVILGDNIFEEKIFLNDFIGGARIYLKNVSNPKAFGIAEIDEKNIILNIEEKPENPKSNLAVAGLYVYDHSVFDIIKSIKPSSRGELEITDVNNEYIKQGKMQFKMLKGFWQDAGDFEGLFKANQIIKEKCTA